MHQQQWRAFTSGDRVQAQLPVSTYRLVNVSLNPVGRFGAPETEPGPSGVGRPAEDELMGIPFHKT